MDFRVFVFHIVSTDFPQRYSQKRMCYPQKKTIVFSVHMLRCMYINYYSKKSSTYLKYTSDFGQDLPKEFQFDEFNTNRRSAYEGVFVHVH